MECFITLAQQLADLQLAEGEREREREGGETKINFFFAFLLSGDGMWRRRKNGLGFLRD